MKVSEIVDNYKKAVTPPSEKKIEPKADLKPKTERK